MAVHVEAEPEAGAKAAQLQQAVAQQFQQQQAAVAGAAGGLPPGWVQGTDPSTGAAYYYNAAMGRTQWETPTA